MMQTLSFLVERLQSAKNSFEVNEILDEQSFVRDFLSHHPILNAYTQGLKSDCGVVIKSILAIGQGPVVFRGVESIPEPFEALREFVQMLIPVESFYQPIGGLVGYHNEVVRLINRKEKLPDVTYRKPHGVDISSDPLQYIRKGIEGFPGMAEIFPVGGAGDRLNLRDLNTDEPLPAAQLMFQGKTLLEGLIRDLQAREYLYEKIFEKSLITPIVLMTSEEKHNYQRIVKICEDKKWFNRPKESFFFLKQPLVPVITKEGEWVMQGPLKLMTKPGGHGAIWKLALDAGVFEWLKGKDRNFALIRQINNPIAGIDSGLLAFVGVGLEQKKAFGFASCPRLLNTHEGMLVLVEKDAHYHIGNIEYTDFALHGVEDVPEEEGSPYSAYPTNTNILFADLDEIQKAVNKNPIPGNMINMKIKAPGKDVACGRLESMMQSIADEIVDDSPDHLRTYLTYGIREKTISVAKQAYIEGKSKVGTPEGAFEDLEANAYELLKEKCQMELSQDCLIQYHPALGPLYSIIAQKIQGGSLSPGSELKLEIAELEMKDCRIEGSLLIEADSYLKGRCILKGVNVKNKGIDRSAPNCYWKNEISRLEEFKIILHGYAEFIAENLSIEGSYQIEVQNGHRTVAFQADGRVHFRTEKIALPTWKWEYQIDQNGQVILSKEQIGDRSPIC